MSRSAESSPSAGSRRQFLQASGAALAGATLAAAPGNAGVHVGGDDVIKVGLIGCGGRGTGAATQALNADPHVKLVAMGDVFPDRLAASLKQLKNDKLVSDKVDVKPENWFTGFDAFRGVL